MAPSPSDNPFSLFSSAPAPSAFNGGSRANRNRAANVSRPAGRPVETLEIDSDSDDDVVEVIDVEALI
jgi:hypothetical protein